MDVKIIAGEFFVEFDKVIPNFLWKKKTKKNSQYILIRYFRKKKRMNEEEEEKEKDGTFKLRGSWKRHN